MTKTAPKTTLTDEQQATLAKCERDITRSMKSFFVVVTALRDILRGNLLPAPFKRFTTYCEVRWDMDPTASSRYRMAIEVIDAIENAGLQCPSNEAQCRELGRYIEVTRVDGEKRYDTAKMVQIWRDVLDKNQDINSGLIKSVGGNPKRKKTQNTNGSTPSESRTKTHAAIVVSGVSSDALSDLANRLGCDMKTVGTEHSFTPTTDHDLFIDRVVAWYKANEVGSLKIEFVRPVAALQAAA